jgi:hypothetical protein
MQEQEKQKRSALNPLGQENREANQRLRQERRDERQDRRDDPSRRKLKQSLREDLDDLSRKDARQFSKLSQKGSRQEKQEARVDRRRQRGEKLGQDPFVAASREIVSQQFPFEDSLVQLFMTEEEFNQYGLRGFDFLGGLRDLGNGIRGEKKDRKFKNLLSRLGVCGLTKLGQKAVQCLLGGVDLDTGLRAIIRAALGSMSPSVMERLLIGLDPRVQEDIRQQVQREFRNMPAPWEVGYKPGSKRGFTGETRETAFNDKVDSVQAKIDNLEEVIDSLSVIGFLMMRRASLLSIQRKKYSKM